MIRYVGEQVGKEALRETTGESEHWNSLFKRESLGASGWLRRLSVCLQLGHDLQIMGSSPALGCLLSGESASHSPSVPPLFSVLSLSLCLSLSQKQKKSLRKIIQKKKKETRKRQFSLLRRGYSERRGRSLASVNFGSLLSLDSLAKCWM